MTITYRITFEDFADAQRLHRAKAMPLWRRSFRWLMFGVVLLALGFLLLGWFMIQDQKPSGNVFPLSIAGNGYSRSGFCRKVLEADLSARSKTPARGHRTYF